jgi:hypothetical protein
VSLVFKPKASRNMKTNSETDAFDQNPLLGSGSTAEEFAERVLRNQIGERAAEILRTEHKL